MCLHRQRSRNRRNTRRLRGLKSWLGASELSSAWKEPCRCFWRRIGYAGGRGRRSSESADRSTGRRRSVHCCSLGIGSLADQVARREDQLLLHSLSQLGNRRWDDADGFSRRPKRSQQEHKPFQWLNSCFEFGTSILQNRQVCCLRFSAPLPRDP